MILIGVTGKSGAGKTTLSKYIEKKYPNIIRVGVDEIVRNEGLIKDRNEIIEELLNHNISAQELKAKQLNYRKKLDYYVNEKIRIEETNLTEIAIIDYALLYELPQIWEKLNYKILVTKKEDFTRIGLIKRCGKEKAEKLEIVNKRICVSDESIKVDYKIQNDEDIEKFYRGIDTVIKDILKKSELTK